MPGPSATLFNHETNTYEEVPAEQVGAAIASGKYAGGGSVTTQSASGGILARPIEQLGAAVVQGESLAEGATAAKAAQSRLEDRKAVLSDRALTFVEGVGDALTIGLMHGTTEEDELRREVNSGSALLGQLVGTGVGLKLPGLGTIASGGEKLGGGVARALLGEAESGFRGAIARGLEEAGTNAALMAATSFGHAITDTVIADKPFAAESIIHEAGIGAVLGFGAGWLGSSFGQLAKSSRAAVEASGVAAKESEAALGAVNDLTQSWDDALEAHSRKLGVLRVLADEGHVPGAFMEERATALSEAKSARNALRELDAERAMGSSPKEYQKWRSAVEEYDGAIRRLDESMSPSALERARPWAPVVPGPRVHPDYMPGGSHAAEGAEMLKGPQGRAYGRDIDQAEADSGVVYKQRQELDHAMANGVGGKTAEELQAAYHETWGKPFEPLRGAELEPATSPLNRELSGDTLERAQQLTNAGRANKRRPMEQPPAEVVEAGTPPATPVETGQEFVDANKRAQATAPTGPDGKKAVRDYLDNWAKEYDSTPRVSSREQLDARLTEALDKISKVGGSRLDSAGGLELTKSLGLGEPASALGTRLDQVWSLGQAGKFAADEARGVKTPLRKGLIGMLERYGLRRGSRALASATVGGAMGGPIGAILGYALTSTGFAGAAASAAGKLAKQVATVGEALLRGRNATLAVKAVTGNRPYQYSDEGPVTDPVQRIIELQRMATNPDAIRARVNKQLADLTVTSPEMAQHLADTTVNHIQAIAMSAPAIMMSPLGRPIQPSGTAMTKFFDFENAMHDLPGTLQALGRGSASAAQIKAFHVGYPAVYASLVKDVVGDTEGLDKLNEAKLRTIEKALGIPLTRASADPLYTARLQTNWAAPKPVTQAPQAFKITAPAPMPGQGGNSGRAPGNERKR